MCDNFYPSVRLPSSCKHISYIKSKAITQLLQLSHLDVLDNDRNQCYVPGCQNTDSNQLKKFVLMGSPPKKTYYSVNYIGLGLYPPKNVATDDWYTAYVPLNRECFNDDLYYLKKCLLKVIGNARLWLKGTKEASKPSLEDAETTDSFQELDFSTQPFTQNEQGVTNVFRFPYEPANGMDPEEHIFATPSCMYATKPELATPFEFDELDVKLQILLQIKAKPNSFVTSQNSLTLADAFDPCFPNAEIEWYLSSVEDAVADKILFKILPKADKEAPSPKAEKPQLTKVTLLAANTSLNNQLNADPGFLEIRDLYKTDNAPEAVALDEHENVLLKLKWTEKHNKVIYYLKTLVTNKKLEWDSETKLWRAAGMFLYETTRLATHLGLNVDHRALFRTWTWLKNASAKNLPRIFDVNLFTRWLRDCPVHAYQRVVVDLARDTLAVDVVPYNKELVAMFKGKNTGRNNYTWDRENMVWTCTNAGGLLADLLAVMPALREASQPEQELLESKGVFLAALKTEASHAKRTKQPETRTLHK